MSSHLRQLGVIAVIVAGVLPMTAAQAQYYGGPAQPAPLYPYAVQHPHAVQRDRPYIVQQTPNTYVIQRPSYTRAYPYVRSRSAYIPGDRARIVERHHMVEDEPMRSRRTRAIVEERETGKRTSRDDNKKRVIQADAEVTILGPDRMNIRLFRKGQGPKANARID